MKTARFRRASEVLATTPAAAPSSPLRIPFVRPNPGKLSTRVGALSELEASGIFSNYGPINTRFETRLAQAVFGSERCCVTVANATLGLMLAVKQAVGWQPQRRYALMPSFTFAAAAQAALWCGLTPLLCDVDRDTWLPDPRAEDELLTRYRDEIAVLLPNATFGNCLDLGRYYRISKAREIPLVVDAAAALGSLDAAGRPFGIGSPYPLIFSMHATKAFATGEGGVVYCENRATIAELRAMGNFGFGLPRNATMPGLNTKLSEVGALLALTKLDEFDSVAQRRQELFEHYRALLPEFGFQKMTGRRAAHQFVSVLLPEACSAHVVEVIETLRQSGIGAARYFVPHLAAQPFFRETCVAGDLAVTEAICDRIIALPMFDTLAEDDIAEICNALRRACGPLSVQAPSSSRRAVRPCAPRALSIEQSP